MTQAQLPPRGVWPGRIRLSRPRPGGRRRSVTVVFPCYKYGHYLPGAVASALDQEGVDVRVVIVDDASPDGSGEVAERLAAQDPRIRCVLHEWNRGHIATYNDGLAGVETDYVALVSADDLLAPGSLRRGVDLMSAHPRVGFVYGRALPFSGTPPTVRPRRAPWTTWNGQEWVRLSCVRGRNFVMSPEVLIRTEALRAVGVFNPDLPHSADLELWLRLGIDWDVGRINGAPQAFYRVHQANMHLTTFATMQVDLRHRYAAFEVLGDHAVRLRWPAASTMLDRARAAIARDARELALRELDSGSDAGVVELLDIADELAPAQRATRDLRARLEHGVPSGGVWVRPRNLVRAQSDRVRWKAWTAVGLS